ncbi:MAG: DUF2924 domain-containing protein [Candidatus Binataceae bacterium]
MKGKISVTPSALIHEIGELKQTTAADLKERWRALYGTEPPWHISRDLLIRALAYRIQERALGGLKPSTRRLLAKVAADASARVPIQVAPESALKPGTVLLREWHGTQHQQRLAQTDRRGRTAVERGRYRRARSDGIRGPERVLVRERTASSRD